MYSLHYFINEFTLVDPLGRLKKLSKLMPEIQNINGPEKASENVKVEQTSARLNAACLSTW